MVATRIAGIVGEFLRNSVPRSRAFGAIPPLGCGSGGLDWSQVKQLIEAALSEVSAVDVVVYPPTDEYGAT
jgi:hypothetical protein